MEAYGLAAVGLAFVVAGFLTEQVGLGLISMGVAFLIAGVMVFAVAGGRRNS